MRLRPIDRARRGSALCRMTISVHILMNSLIVDDLYSSHLHLLAPIENSINWDGASNREQEATANSQHYNAASLLHVCRTRCFLSSEMDLQSNPSWL